MRDDVRRRRNGPTELIGSDEVELYEKEFFGMIGSKMRVNKGYLDNVHPIGVWCSHEPIVSPEDLRILDEELGCNLETRGRRDLKWYGANWLGHGDLNPTAPLPQRSQEIVDKLCKRTGFPKVTVATLHRYYRSKAQRATAQQLGPKLAGRKMAIVPHTDDKLLTGNGGVMMVQVGGDAEVAMVQRGKGGGPAKFNASCARPLGHVVVCEGEAFQSPHQHAVLWTDDARNEVMTTLTIRSIALPWARNQDVDESKAAAPQVFHRSGSEQRDRQDSRDNRRASHQRDGEQGRGGRGDSRENGNSGRRGRDGGDDRNDRDADFNGRRRQDSREQDRWVRGGRDTRDGRDMRETRDVRDGRDMRDTRDRDPRRTHDGRDQWGRRDSRERGAREDRWARNDNRREEERDSRDRERHNGRDMGERSRFADEGSNLRNRGRDNRDSRDNYDNRERRWDRDDSRDERPSRNTGRQDDRDGRDDRRGRDGRDNRRNHSEDEPRRRDEPRHDSDARDRRRDGDGRNMRNERMRRDSEDDWRRGRERDGDRDRFSRDRDRGARDAPHDSRSRDRRPDDAPRESRDRDTRRDTREASREAVRDMPARDSEPRDRNAPPRRERSITLDWSWDEKDERIPAPSVALKDMSYSEVREQHSQLKQVWNTFREAFKQQNGRYPCNSDLQHPNLAAKKDLFDLCTNLTNEKHRRKEQGEDRKEKKEKKDRSERKEKKEKKEKKDKKEKKGKKEAVGSDADA